jgi:hypothetical protein
MLTFFGSRANPISFSRIAGRSSKFGEQESLKAMRAAVHYVDAVRACVQAEYRCRKALPRDEATRKKLLQMFATQGLITAMQSPPEKTTMLDTARDLRDNFVQPLYMGEMAGLTCEPSFNKGKTLEHWRGQIDIHGERTDHSISRCECGNSRREADRRAAF